jgi:hypothetical protein
MTSAPTRTLPAFITRLGARERLALAGGALAIAGGLVVVAAAGQNANGVAGPMIVVVIGAAIAVASVILRRGRRELVTALAVGLLLVAIVEAIPPIRYSADLDAFGGILGVVARAVALAGAMALLVGVAGRIDPGRIIDLESPLGRLPMLLVLAGTALLLVGWLALVTIGVGFAPRVIDGLALVGASLAGATARIGAVEGPSAIRLALRFAPVVLAAIVAIVTLGSVLAIGDRFADLLGSGPVSVVAYLVYVASAVPLVAAAALVLLPLVRPLASRP